MSDNSGRVWGLNRTTNRVVVDVGRGLVVFDVLEPNLLDPEDEVQGIQFLPGLQTIRDTRRGRPLRVYVVAPDATPDGARSLLSEN